MRQKTPDVDLIILDNPLKQGLGHRRFALRVHPGRRRAQPAFVAKDPGIVIAQTDPPAVLRLKAGKAKELFELLVEPVIGQNHLTIHDLAKGGGFVICSAQWEHHHRLGALMLFEIHGTGAQRAGVGIAADIERHDPNISRISSSQATSAMRFASAASEDTTALSPH